MKPLVLLFVFMFSCVRGQTYGGTDVARIEDYNYAVRVRNIHPRTNGEASCTGSIIHENWVVTAAHCVSQPGHRISVVAGDIWRVDQGRQRSQNRREYVVSRVFSHPGYEGRDPGREKQIPDYFDIALLHFEGGIVFNNSVGAIRYRPGNGQREPYLPHAEQMCTIMGWGKTEFKLPPADHNYSKGKQRTPADRLKYADDMPVAMISETESKTVNGRRYHSRTIKVHRGDDGKRTMNGDSGGPLICENRRREKVLCGVLRGRRKYEGEDQQQYEVSSYNSINGHWEWMRETIREEDRQRAWRQRQRIQGSTNVWRVY